jgi:hypothetical protein
MCTARGRSSLIPSRVSPRWRATLRAGARWRATLRAGESLDGSNPAAREPLHAGESTHLRSQRTPGGYLARGTPPSSPRGDAANSKTARWPDRLPCVLALHGWGHPPLASHAVNALMDQTVGGVPSPTPWIITIPGRRPVPPRPRGFREPPACGCSPALLVAAHRPAAPPDHGGKQGA